MAKVRRANVILEVKDDQVERYVDQGYDVIADDGSVLKKSTPKDIATLTMAYNQHIAEIESLKAEIKKLKSQKKAPAKKSGGTKTAKK